MVNSEYEFDDITIVGVDKSRTYNPEPTKLLYNVYLELSTKPPYEWGKFFEEEHRFPRMSMWRRVRVEGQYIVLYCPLEEVADHLEYLKQDAVNANQRYQEWTIRETARKDAKQRREDAEEKRKNKLLDALDFD